MNPQPTIFISSIISEFYDLRGALKYFLGKSGFRVLMSEESDFGADCGLDSLDNCKNQIEKADYYLLLIGDKPGTIFELNKNETTVTFEEFRHYINLVKSGKSLNFIAFIRKQTWNNFENKDHSKIHPLQLSLISELLENSLFEDKKIGRWRYTFDRFGDIISVLETNQNGLFLEATRKTNLYRTYIIGGTSNGATISALYAMGYSPKSITAKCRRAWIESKPFKDYTLPLISLLKGRKFDNVTRVIFKGTQIEDLWINFFCVSSNLSTADVEIHLQGPLWKAIRASNSVPGIVPPVIDCNHLLVDGGALNNLPGDIMYRLCGGVVLAVDVSAEKDFFIPDRNIPPSPWKIIMSHVLPFQKAISFPGILSLLVRSSMLWSLHKVDEVKSHVDFYLRPPVESYSMFDFPAIDEIVRIGYDYTKKKIKDWKPFLSGRLREQ